MKKLTGILLLTVLLALFAGGAAFARNLALKDGKVAFFVPETWKNDFQNNIVSTESPDGGVAVPALSRLGFRCRHAELLGLVAEPEAGRRHRHLELGIATGGR